VAKARSPEESFDCRWFSVVVVHVELHATNCVRSGEVQKLEQQPKREKTGRDGKQGIASGHEMDRSSAWFEDPSDVLDGSGDAIDVLKQGPRYEQINLRVAEGKATRDVGHDRLVYVAIVSQLLRRDVDGNDAHPFAARDRCRVLAALPSPEIDEHAARWERLQRCLNRLVEAVPQWPVVFDSQSPLDLT
jgi:hypothetical protein